MTSIPQNGATLHPNTDNLGFFPDRIPAELRALDSWMHSFGTDANGDFIKRPRIAGTPVYGSKTDPADWRAFGIVLAAIKRFGGLPYLVATPDDPYCLIDFDKCRDPLTGELTPWAQGYADWLDTYTEASLSGTGIRLVVKSDAHFIGSKQAKADGRAVEVYAKSHGCIMTGRVLRDRPVRGGVDTVLAGLRNDVRATREVPTYEPSAYTGEAASLIEEMAIPHVLTGWRADAWGVQAACVCPWSGDHTTDGGTGETVVGQRVNPDGTRGGLHFKCYHASHEVKRWADFRHVAMPGKRLMVRGVLARPVFGGAR